MYTFYDLTELEGKTDLELRAELKEAKARYEYIQNLYEKDNDNNPFEEKINLKVIFMHLKNIEMYIRRIENLLYEFEVDRVFIRKAVNRRNARLSRLP